MTLAELENAKAESLKEIAAADMPRLNIAAKKGIILTQN